MYTNIYGGDRTAITRPANKKSKCFQQCGEVSDFVLGQSTTRPGRRIARLQNVPVFEMRGKRLIITMYRKDHTVALKNSAPAVMKKWDND